MPAHRYFFLWLLRLINTLTYLLTYLLTYYDRRPCRSSVTRSRRSSGHLQRGLSPLETPFPKWTLIVDFGLDEAHRIHEITSWWLFFLIGTARDTAWLSIPCLVMAALPYQRTGRTHYTYMCFLNVIKPCNYIDVSVLSSQLSRNYSSVTRTQACSIMIKTVHLCQLKCNE